MYQATFIERTGDSVIDLGKGNWLVSSKSNPGGWYPVKDLFDNLVCECKGYENRYHCRHITGVVALQWMQRRAANPESGRQAVAEIQALSA